MSRVFNLIFVALLVSAYVLPLGALAAVDNTNDLGQMLDDANDFFRQANEQQDEIEGAELYQKALLRFEGLVNGGVKNGKLYYNIGNNYFRLHDLGRAILNYRRAQRYIAGDENLHQNLAYALSLQPDKIELKQESQILRTLLFWHYDLSAKVKLIIVVIMNFCFWTLLLFKLKKPGLRLGWALLLSSLMVIAFGTSIVSEKTGLTANGVLVSPEVIARKGDGLSYSPSFNGSLHAGLDFTLLEKRGEWFHVELLDGRKCWIPSATAEII